MKNTVQPSRQQLRQVSSQVSPHPARGPQPLPAELLRHVAGGLTARTVEFAPKGTWSSSTEDSRSAPKGTW